MQQRPSFPAKEGAPIDEKATGGSFACGDIGQIALHARDLETMVAFYRDVLGLKLLFRAPPGLAFFAAGPVRLMLENAAKEPAGNSVIYFRVDDIQAAHAAVRARGATTEGEPHLIARMPDHDLWMTFVRDPEANLVGMMSEVRRAQP